MRTVTAACLSGLLLIGCAASPDQESATVPASRYENTADAKRNAGDEDVICTYEKRIGSHMKQAICMTKKQREDLQESSRDEAQRANRNMGRGNQDGAGI